MKDYERLEDDRQVAEKEGWFLVVGAEPEKLPELPVAETTTETCQRVSKYRRCQRELEDSR